MVLSGRVEKEKHSPKAKSAYKFHSTEMVLVDVGGDNGELHTFSVHKHIICHYSAFFKAACVGLVAAAEKVKLPYDRAELFDLFVQWLYSQNLKQIFASVTLPTWRTLIELHILADKLQALTLKNAILDRMFCMVDWGVGHTTQKDMFPTNADISIAYENTSVTSPMRKFLAELFALLRQFPVEKDEVPKDYLYDLVIALKLRWDARYELPYEMKELCRYHEHGSDEERRCTKPDSRCG